MACEPVRPVKSPFKSPAGSCNGRCDGIVTLGRITLYSTKATVMIPSTFVASF